LKLKAAYNRQSRKFKRKVRSDMLWMYASLGDWENARKFVSTRDAWSAADMFWTMDVLLALDLLDNAKHDWETAIEMWQQAPLDEPLRRNALSGIVQIHLARAFEAIESGLNALAELKRNPELSLCLPGNDLRMTEEAEKELLKFKRGIDKLLPERARKELGIIKAS
jgi:hypothetical protein